jgi:hypothetical protein
METEQRPTEVRGRQKRSKVFNIGCLGLRSPVADSGGGGER